MDVEGKHALVTGGSSGIGFAITRALVRAGATVVIVGRDKARLEAARRLSPSIMSVVADLTDRGERQRLIDHVSDTALPLDILVNNAGTRQTFGLTDDDAVARIDRELALNLHAPVHLSTALLPRLLERPEGAIVNVTAGGADDPRGAAPGYAAAKDGLKAFTRSLRGQIGGAAVRVIDLMPPAADPMTGHLGPKVDAYGVATALIDGLRDGLTEVRPGTHPPRRGVPRLVPGFIARILDRAAGGASCR